MISPLLNENGEVRIFISSLNLVLMIFSFAMRLASSSKYSSNKNILKYKFVSSLNLVFNEFFLCDEAGEFNCSLNSFRNVIHMITMLLRLKLDLIGNITNFFNIQNYYVRNAIKAFGKVTQMVTICDLKLTAFTTT